MVDWKAHRVAAKLTQIQVIQEMRNNGFNWHQSTLYKIENKIREVEFIEGLFLCALYGVKIEEIKLPTNDSYVVI